MEKLNQADKNFAQGIIDFVKEPMVILDHNFNVLCWNKTFFKNFKTDKSLPENVSFFELNDGQFKLEPLQAELVNISKSGNPIKKLSIDIAFPKTGIKPYCADASKLETPMGNNIIVLSLKKQKKIGDISKKGEKFLRVFNDILSKAPAAMCTLRGPDHVFEIANENYFQLIGKRDIIGKSVKEVLPEVEGQGFIELLDNVYETGEAFIGKEIPIRLNRDGETSKNSFLDFIYQPTKSAKGVVEGIFVHAINVTKQVEARNLVENSEKHLQNLIDTVPAMIWITNKIGESVYLNNSWYDYTGQIPGEAQGFGWLNATHPDDKKIAEVAFVTASEQQKAYSVSFRLRNKNGKYRWVVDRGSPKFNEKGEFEGMVGTVLDVHEERLKEQLVHEGEHRIRNIVNEATVATGIYVGREMKIELANEAILELWGKDSSVIGKTLRQALPELEGQPFHDLLDEVYTTGNTYWGQEDKVDLVINGKLKPGYFNFTYKPLRNENGEIYGILNMAVDVTELVHSKMLVKESEAHFRQMADLMPTKVTNTDATGVFLYFNQGWLDFTGVDLEELKRTGWFQFIHPDQKEKFLELWERSLQTGENFEMEIRCRNKEGNYKWQIHRAEAVKDESGKNQMWIGATIDIQEQKEVMERLEYSKALLETHNQANIDGVLLVDTKGKIISYNQRFIDIWKMPSHIVEQNNDHGALEFASNQLYSSKAFLKTVEELYESPNQVVEDELEFKDGRIILRHGYPVVGVDKTFYAWSWTFRDITLQKNHEKSIKESELYYRQMTDLMPGKINNTNALGNPTYFNEHWLEYTGLSKEELKTRGWIQFIHPKQQKKFIKSWNRSLESGENFEIEIKLLNKNGNYKWHISRAEAVMQESGRINMWICTNTEIQKLKEEEKRKGDFLKMVSHELKTPVTSIKGYVQLLLGLLNTNKDLELGAIPLKPSLERIDHQIRRLTRLISEMLDLSRIEENKLELQKETFNLNDLVIETVQDIIYTNTEHKIEIINNFDCQVYADKDRIGQVIINYVTNAIKYSPDHQNIQVIIEKQEDNRVSVSVKDNGIGIDKKYHKSIFKRFYRVGVKSEETYAGFGIGLYLVKEIIHRHKGVTLVKSKKGKGSEFIFILNTVSSKINK